MNWLVNLRRTVRGLALLAWLAGNVALWLLLPPVPRQTIPLPEQWRRAILSPDGSAVATLNAQTTGADDGPLRLWDVATGRVRWELPGDEKVRAYLRFTLDGTGLFVQSGANVGNMSFHCLDVATGRERFALPCGNMGVFNDYPHNAPDYSCFSPDGGTFYYLAGEPGGRLVRACDTATGELRATLRGAYPPVACSSDGRTLVVGMGEDAARLWDLATLQERGRLVMPRDAFLLHEFRFAPDGRTFAGRLYQRGQSGSETAVGLWDAATGQLRVSLPEMLIGLSPDGERLITSGYGPLSGHVNVRSAATGEPQRTYPLAAVYGLTWLSPDGRCQAVQGRPLSASVPSWPWLVRLLRRIEGNEGRVRLVDSETGRGLGTVTGQVFAERADELFAADSRSLLTQSGLAVHVWDVPPRKPLTLFLGLLAGQLAVAALVWRWRRRRRAAAERR
jgi:WD40 repeat protein